MDNENVSFIKGHVEGIVKIMTFKRRMMERLKIDDKSFNKQLKELERESNE